MKKIEKKKIIVLTMEKKIRFTCLYEVDEKSKIIKYSWKSE